MKIKLSSLVLTSMQYIVTLFFLLFTSCSIIGHQNRPVSSDIYLASSSYKNNYYEVFQYRKKGDLNNIEWSIFKNKSNNLYNLTLRYLISPDNKGLLKSFEEQISTHKQILGHIFKRFEMSKITTVRFGTLKEMNPTMRWNCLIAKAASKNKDWLDYRRQYPNHKSKKSSNRILLEIINQDKNILRGFKEIFKPHYRLKLVSVEKVFTYKKNDLASCFEKFSISARQRLIGDAGVFTFSLERQTPR